MIRSGEARPSRSQRKIAFLNKANAVNCTFYGCINIISNDYGIQILHPHGSLTWSHSDPAKVLKVLIFEEVQQIGSVAFFVKIRTILTEILDIEKGLLVVHAGIECHYAFETSRLRSIVILVKESLED